MPMVVFQEWYWHWPLVMLHGLAAFGLLRALVRGMRWLKSGGGWLKAGLPLRGILWSWVILVVTGGMLYPDFRVNHRAAYVDQHYPWITGLFEIKEHSGAFGLALLLALFLLRNSQQVPHLAYGRMAKWSLCAFAFLTVTASLVGTGVLILDLFR
ncbi:MAG: hypothetical protein AMXMBFR75_18160 [Candidatus Hinthialibacteria bacterium]|nr:hypothetical protein [bacterium]MBK7496307.1 hypothetical protein [Candidatus Omnitrophota bacterium]MBV6482225.1 hypothetical protein [bacterium]MCE7909294.1 hypothetical protein [Candidatus Omnitrophica bacterium COP1]